MDGADGVGADDPMHGQSPVVHDARMGERHRPAGWRRGVCACGCGTVTPTSKKGRHYTWLDGHCPQQGRSEAEWRTIYEALVKSMPLCRCGCGEQVVPHGSTFERFRRWGGLSGHPEYRRGHLFRSPLWHTELEPLERQAILGTLLGDSCIRYPNESSTCPHVVSNHGTVQTDWALHKAKILGRLRPVISEKENRGYGARIISTKFPCLPCFVPIHDLVHREGRKRITREWLDQIGYIGLAWWLADDGSCNPAGAFHIHTEGFPEEDVHIAVQWFEDNYGAANVLRVKQSQTGKVYHIVSLLADCRFSVLKAVAPHIPPSMDYKLRAFRLPIRKRIRRSLRLGDAGASQLFR